MPYDVGLPKLASFRADVAAGGRSVVTLSLLAGRAQEHAETATTEALEILQHAFRQLAAWPTGEARPEVSADVLPNGVVVRGDIVADGSVQWWAHLGAADSASLADAALSDAQGRLLGVYLVEDLEMRVRDARQASRSQ